MKLIWITLGSAFAAEIATCKAKYTCGLLRDCCQEHSECFSACCSAAGQCTDISVCAEISGYTPPMPKTTPLFEYLQDQSTRTITPEVALSKVEDLLNQKQCYTHALYAGAETYNYKKADRSFTIPTDRDYEYNEKSLLKGQNIGYFGFGVPVKTNNYDKSSPYSYSYYTDYQQARFKAIDEFYGAVNEDADQTYNGQYYYYYSYYTYEAGRNYWYDTFDYQEQTGNYCYSYSQNTASNYDSQYWCERTAQAYTVKHAKFGWTLVGVIALTLVAGSTMFACCETRVVRKRDGV